MPHVKGILFVEDAMQKENTAGGRRRVIGLQMVVYQGGSTSPARQPTPLALIPVKRNPSTDCLSPVSPTAPPSQGRPPSSIPGYKDRDTIDH
jgi:hypothetical protein